MLGELHVVHRTEGQRSGRRQFAHAAVGRAQQRLRMAGAGEFERARFRLERSGKHRDEHARFEFLIELAVESGEQLVRPAHVPRERADSQAGAAVPVDMHVSRDGNEALGDIRVRVRWRPGRLTPSVMASI